MQRSLFVQSLWPTVSTQPYGVPNTSMTPPLPTKRSFISPDATVYVTAGNGGSPGPDGGAGDMPGARRGSEQYGYGRLVAHTASHLTWTQVANKGGGGIIDEWTVVQHDHGRFYPGRGLAPPPPSGPVPPPPTPGPVVKAGLKIVSLDICRHYWNWACNASGIPGRSQLTFWACLISFFVTQIRPRYRIHMVKQNQIQNH